MSLINDALKKAQKQRTGETPALGSMPSVGGQTPHQIARRPKPPGFNTLMVQIGAGAAVLLIVVVGGYFAFRSDSDDRRQTADASPVAGVADPEPASSRPATPSPNIAPQPAAAPSFTLQTALPADAKQSAGQTPGSQQGTTAHPLPAPSSTVVAKVELPKSPASAPTTKAPGPSPLASSPAVQASGPALPAPKLEPRAIQFIEAIKVAGIRASATDPKVLMNDRVYRPGSIVEAELGLKLVEIATGALTFEDERGGRYTRTF